MPVQICFALAMMHVYIHEYLVNIYFTIQDECSVKSMNNHHTHTHTNIHAQIYTHKYTRTLVLIDIFTKISQILFTLPITNRNSAFSRFIEYRTGIFQWDYGQCSRLLWIFDIHQYNTHDHPHTLEPMDSYKHRHKDLLLQSQTQL